MLTKDITQKKLAAVAAALLLAGTVAFSQLPVAPLPKTDFPTISVSAALPGTNSW